MREEEEGGEGTIGQRCLSNTQRKEFKKREKKAIVFLILWPGNEARRINVHGKNKHYLGSQEWFGRSHLLQVGQCTRPVCVCEYVNSQP